MESTAITLAVTRARRGPRRSRRVRGAGGRHALGRQLDRAGDRPRRRPQPRHRAGRVPGGVARPRPVARSEQLPALAAATDTASRVSRAADRTAAREAHRRRELDTLVGQAVDPRPTPATTCSRRRAQAAAIVLDELPDDAREVVTLYYREGQSTAHVAALLGLSEANVRQRLSARAHACAPTPRSIRRCGREEPTRCTLHRRRHDRGNDRRAGRLVGRHADGGGIGRARGSAKLLAFGGGAIARRDRRHRRHPGGQRDNSNAGAIDRGARSDQALRATAIGRSVIRGHRFAAVLGSDAPAVVVGHRVHGVHRAAWRHCSCCGCRESFAIATCPGSARGSGPRRRLCTERRRFAILGWALGLVTGGLGLIAAILLAG